MREAGDIVLRRLQGWMREPGAPTFWSSSDAPLAVALRPSDAILWMLEEMKCNPFRCGQFLVSLAEHAPHIDIRPQLAEFLAAEKDQYSAKDLAPHAISRGVPEGFDAAVRVLRDPEAAYAHKELLDSVRKHAGFSGAAAQWIEQNRNRLVWNESKKRFVLR